MPLHICLLAKFYCHNHHCCSNMPTGWVLLHDGCLLDCGHSVCLLSFNIACLLALCFSICYTCWYGVSRSAVSADIVSYYQPCLLVWWGAITSDMFADPVPISDMPACSVQLYQICMLGSFIQILVFVKCFSIRREIWYVTNPPNMSKG